MLIGTAAVAEPAVICDIDDPARALAARHHVARKNDLVADQRQRNRRAWYSDRPAPIAGKETAALLGELLKTKAPEDSFERQIFAERHEVHFVVKRDDRTGVVDGVHRLIDRRRARIDWLRDAHGARAQPGVWRQQLGYL